KPTPQVLGDSGIRSPFLAILLQSSFSNRPSSQPRPMSPDSTSTTSQLTCLASTMALILACSPLYSTTVTLLPVCASNGLLKAAFCASPLAPPKLTTVISAACAPKAMANAPASRLRRIFVLCFMLAPLLALACDYGFVVVLRLRQKR